MKILALIPSYRPSSYPGRVGGGEISNRILLEGLAARGHQVVVVTTDSAGYKGRQESGVTVYDSSFSCANHAFQRMLSYSLFRRVALRTQQAEKCEVVICATSALGVAMEVSRENGIRCGVIVRAFENFFGRESSKISRVEKLKRRIKSRFVGDSFLNSQSSVDFAIVNSDFMKQEFLNTVGRDVAEIVYPPITFPEKKSKKNSSEKILSIGMVGGVRKKGVYIFLELAKRLPDVSFNIYGGIDVDVSKQLINLPNVFARGWLPTSEIYCRDDVFLVPSICQETFGRVAVEGLLAKKIVLVSNRGGLPEAVLGCERLIVEPENVDAWYSVVTKVMAEPGLYDNACQELQAGLAIYDQKEQLNRFEHILESNLMSVRE